jgi:hypothetical protein
MLIFVNKELQIYKIFHSYGTLRAFNIWFIAYAGLIGAFQSESSAER